MAYQKSINIKNWLETGFIKRAQTKFPTWVKEYILKEQNYECFECKITKWNNKSIVLEIEHKDGNSTNDRRDNLSCLCPNCHSQTPTYKSKNKGNGRHTRRQRYEDGKSY